MVLWVQLCNNTQDQTACFTSFFQELHRLVSGSDCIWTSLRIQWIAIKLLQSFNGDNTACQKDSWNLISSMDNHIFVFITTSITAPRPNLDSYQEGAWRPFLVNKLCHQLAWPSNLLQFASIAFSCLLPAS